MHSDPKELELQKPEYALIRIADVLEEISRSLWEIQEDVSCIQLYEERYWEDWREKKSRAEMEREARIASQQRHRESYESDELQDE